MASATGTVSSLNALYDALITFVAANGWTLTETITTRDKVYRSVGTDSKRSMYARLTSSAEAGNPFKAAADYHKVVPNILVRGYQNWAAGVGLNEFGYAGPFISAGQATIASQQFYHHPFEATPVPTSYPAIRAKGLSATIAGLNQWGRFSNDRYMFQGTNTAFFAYDLITGEVQTSTAHASAANMQTNQVCVVYTPATNTTHVYGLAVTATLADQLWRWNPDTQEMVRMGAPVWAASAPTAGGLVWDGADTLYAVKGNGTTDFAKYTISTNTWTNLTATSSARNATFLPNNGCCNNITYIPAAVSGAAEDNVVLPLLITGTTLHKYNVTANTWGTVTTSYPLTMNVQAHSFFDGRKYLYFGLPTAAAAGWHRAAVDGPGIGTFTSLGTIQETVRGFEGSDLVNHLCCRLRSHASLHTYWFFGDADGITCVTKINGFYYWMQFGRFTSTYRSEVMKTTAGATAGAQVTVAVDSTTNYSAGDTVLLFDPASNKVEKQTIQQVPGGTSIVINLTNNYGTGSLIGVDPDNFVLTGDSCWANCLLDGGGYRTDPMSATYVIQPQFDNKEEFTRYNPSGRGFVLPVPVKISSFYSQLPNTYETRGTLKNVYSIPKFAYPAPQAEDIVRVDGKQYLVIEPAYSKRLTTHNHLIVVGPF